MKRLTIIAALFFTSILTYGQTYQVGVIAAGTYSQKMDGNIIVADSTVTISFVGKSQELKITNRTVTYIYVTDGTAINKLTVVPLVGKLKGFPFDHTITYELDKRFSADPSSIFYCAVKK